jgi:hypothetical protein
MNESFSKIDIIIIIVLALLVAFIIGFNIIQIIDNKLNSVVINVPPQNCSLPPILVNFDKDNNPIKLNNEQLNFLAKTNPELVQNNKETFNNIEYSVNSNDSVGSANSELDQTVKTSDSDYSENFGNVEVRENYGSLPIKYEERDDEHIDRFAQRLSSNLGNDLIDKSNGINVQDPNYNVIDNYPYLVDPDDAKEGYYESRVKLITDDSSPLLKLEQLNLNKINQVLNTCIKNEKPLETNGTYDGYNKYPNLQGGSFANFTSIGKSLLTPYVSYPVPS